MVSTLVLVGTSQPKLSLHWLLPNKAIPKQNAQFINAGYFLCIKKIKYIFSRNKKNNGFFQEIKDVPHYPPSQIKYKKLAMYHYLLKVVKANY
jgi:hypothetical protein